MWIGMQRMHDVAAMFELCREGEISRKTYG
jgi:hypothetical protein